jgi:high-affinity nickel-transport protein
MQPLHNLNYVSFAIVELFVVTWGVALTVWHFGHIEDKWQAGLAGIDAKREAQLP